MLLLLVISWIYYNSEKYFLLYNKKYIIETLKLNNNIKDS